jgi:hypothetical protein
MERIIKTIIIIMMILLIIDFKPINVIIYFISIIVLLAIFLINYQLYDISLISYLLIIVYASALAILFGLLIMLLDSNPYKKLDVKTKKLKILENISKDFIIPLKLTLNTSTKLNKYIYISLFLLILISLYILDYFSILLEIIKRIDINGISLYETKDILKGKYNTQDIFKLFNLNIYNNPINLISLFNIINILLIALIGILFILLK